MSSWKLFAVFFCYLLSGCSSDKVNRDWPIVSVSSLHLKEGDLAFRKGDGFESRMILLADPDARSTHVGIIADSSGCWMVIHAVPGEPDFEGDKDRVKMEPLEHFYASSRAVSGEIMRVSDTLGARKAAQNAYAIYRRGVLFDNDFDDTDTTRMYCSELVDYVFRQAGIMLVTGKHRSIGVPGFSGKYLFPSDIQSSKCLYSVMCF